ncbi:prevent-host-death protein, partial [Actinomyces sp. AC-19-1]
VCPAAPADTIGAVDLGRTTAVTALAPLGAASATWDGRTVPTSTTTVLEEADGGTLVVGPRGEGAASAAGSVTTLTADGDLRGLTTAACVPPQAAAWIVGGSAAPGSSSELRLTNPGTTTVTATISLYGPTGPVATTTANQVAVPAGETVSVLLEAAASGQGRLAVSVEADGGVLTPVLVTESLDGETAAGVDVLTSGAAPATELTVPGVALVAPAAQGQVADEGTGATSSDAPVLRVVNPGESPATVSVSTLGTDGEEPLRGATALVVDPGAVFDISLTGLAPGSYGVRLRSDTPVTGAVRLVRSADEHPARSGSLVHDVAWVQAQTGAATRAGALALPRGQSLTSRLVLTNTASAPSTVTLSSDDGALLREVRVPGSSTVSVPVSELEEDAGALSVIGLSAADGTEVVTALVTTTEVEGGAAGTLIGVLAPVTEASSASARQLLLR